MSDDGKVDHYDPEFVKGVFDRCSAQYRYFSYICSFGFTERWRRQCAEALGHVEGEAPEVHDLMAGTGEAWPHVLARLPDTASIVAIDISSGMHAGAVERLHRMRRHRIKFIEDNVLNSQLPEGSADAIISTFGLKTFNREQQARLALLVAATLKPSGRFSFIEASDPIGWPLRPFYRFHLTRVLPLIERLFMQGAQDFSMIGAYSTEFRNIDHFADCLAKEGLRVETHSYFFGTATGVSGEKPSA